MNVNLIIFLLSCYSFYCTGMGLVIAVDKHNNSADFSDLPATFGTAVGSSGLKGFLVAAEPLDACQPIINTPILKSGFDNSSSSFIALVIRGNCDFALKVLNAQNAKFDAAIVFNDVSDDLFRMSSATSSISQQVVIPSVFVGLTSGIDLKLHFKYDPDSPTPYVQLKNDENPFSLKYYLIPFCTVIGTCFLCLCLFMIVKACQQRRRQRRNRLSRQRLKQLPVKQFSKGDEYDVCAICLDDYEEGEKLRILPCHHAYHCACVDPWLTSSKRVCPLCKRKVLSDDETSNSDTEFDNVSTDEQVPLLQSSEAASANASRYATGFSRLNPFSRSYSTSTDASAVERDNAPDQLPTVVVHTGVHESPEFHSVRDGLSDERLFVPASTQPPREALHSSVTSTESIEAYSCQSSSTLATSHTIDSDDSDVIVLRSGSVSHVGEGWSNA